MWGLIVESQEVSSGARLPLREPITQQGTKFWVVEEPDGWIEATSRTYKGDQEVPGSVKIFKSATDAQEFAERWKGHPWWCKPNGKYTVVTLDHKLVTRREGYSVINKVEVY